jgi:hypothetical protein
MDTATTSTIDLKIAPEPLATLEEVVKWAKSRNIKMIFDMKDDDIAVTNSGNEIEFLNYPTYS